MFAAEGPRGIADQISRTPESLARSLAAGLKGVAHPKSPRGFDATLVVEFPHRDDVMAKRLLARKRAGLFDAYDLPNWEAALATQFDIRRQETLPSGTRTLYECTPR